jgi:glutaminase
MVKEAYDNFKSDTSGKNAHYIPALAQVKLQAVNFVRLTREQQMAVISHTFHGKQSQLSLLSVRRT